MNSLKIFKAEISKIFGDIKVYWFNYLLGNINVFFLFLGMFFTFSVNNKSPQEALIFLIGLMYWYYGVHAIDLVAIIIEEEIEQGTLELLLTSRSSLYQILSSRMFAQILFDTVKGIFLFIICSIIFNIPLSLFLSYQFLLAVIIFFIGLIGLYGLGFIIAGLSLIFKRTTSLVSIASNIILFFSGTILNIEQLPAIFSIFKIFPLYWSNILITHIFNNTNIPYSTLFIFLLQIIGWNILGYFILNLCLKHVYQKGSTGTY